MSASHLSSSCLTPFPRSGGAASSLGVLSPDNPASFRLSAGSLDAGVVSQYVWGARAGHRDELILRDHASDSGSESSGDFLSERLWCLMDYYDPTSIVDNSGALVERYRFSAFGLRGIMDPDFSARVISDYAWDFAFKSQFLDLDTGYYNYGYRHFSPQIGRWLSRNPINENGGLNLYAMSANDPLNQLDYLGLKCCLLSDAAFSYSGSNIDESGLVTVTASEVFFTFSASFVNNPQTGCKCCDCSVRYCIKWSAGASPAGGPTWPVSENLSANTWYEDRIYVGDNTSTNPARYHYGHREDMDVVPLSPNVGDHNICQTSFIQPTKASKGCFYTESDRPKRNGGTIEQPTSIFGTWTFCIKVIDATKGGGRSAKAIR